MSCDLAASHSLGTTNYPTLCLDGTGARSGSFVNPAEEEATLIMGRLVREYLERRPIGTPRVAATLAHAPPRPYW